MLLHEVWKDTEKDDLFYLGFDAGHCWDLMPFMRERMFVKLASLEHAEYRDMNYMSNECKRLVEQIKDYDQRIEQTKKTDRTRWDDMQTMQKSLR